MAKPKKGSTDDSIIELLAGEWAKSAPIIYLEGQGMDTAIS